MNQHRRQLFLQWERDKSHKRSSVATPAIEVTRRCCHRREEQEVQVFGCSVFRGHYFLQ